MNEIDLLKAEQAKIEERIYEIAKLNNLSSEDIEPIPDGVCDVEKYWSSNPRIMWILKEPYDDWDEKGNPIGGGWQLYGAFDNNDAWKNRTWQPIIYICQGVKDKCHWNDLSWIRDDLSMVDRLKDIAFINVSKMPGNTQSDDGVVKDNYDNYWKEIVERQVKAYKPDVIICGSTYWMIKDIFESEIISKEPVVQNGDTIANVVKTSKNTIIDVYHPNQKVFTRELYVNTLIDLILEAKRVNK